ncbi:MAG: hypothetical protein Q7T27_06490 [Pseudomonas sp.]|uniref:hypothetical protein n=1 Tax=Pseudomonas sp. TaxID=306 RepID=UPI002717AD33|nr:hypothetical protein [Pseudomonas sp.]MDO8403127.1 hypothetical protein [Pseudomonas sp.]
MHLLPRLRLELARRPWLYWSFVGLCALVVWLGIGSADAAARHERARWGTTRTVMVATGSVAAGAPIIAEPAQYPVAIVPPSAVRALPATAVAAHQIAKGEVVVAGAVADGDDVPSGWVVFAVTGTQPPALVPGDAVALFADGAHWCDGIVAAATPEQADVGVPTECAEALSAHLAAGTVVLARAT